MSRLSPPQVERLVLTPILELWMALRLNHSLTSVQSEVNFRKELCIVKRTGVLFLRLISYLVLYRTCNISGFLYTSFTRSSEMNLCPALSVKCILSNLTSEIQIDRSICQILHIICLCLPKFESLFALISFSIILSFSSEISDNGFHRNKTYFSIADLGTHPNMDQCKYPRNSA